MLVETDLISSLEAQFQKNSNKEIAFKSEKYLKGQFKFYGIQSPNRREIKKIQKTSLFQHYSFSIFRVN